MDLFLYKLFIEPFTQYKGLPKSVYIIAIQRFVNALGNFVFPFLTMFMTQKMGLSTEEAGFWVLLSSLSSFIGTTIAGTIVDRVNRKTIIVVVNVLSASLIGICGFLEPGMPIVYIILLTNFLRGFSNPASSAMLSDITNSRKP